MAAKLMSAVTALGVIFIYLTNIQNPSAPMFLFASADSAVNTARLAVAASVLAVSLKQGYTYRFTRTLCVLAGVTLFGLGLTGILMISTDKVSMNYSLLGPLDLIIAMELGLSLAIHALSSKTAGAMLGKPITLPYVPNVAHRISNAFSLAHREIMLRATLFYWLIFPRGVRFSQNGRKHLSGGRWALLNPESELSP